MTYACPAWEFAADTNLMTLQNQENTVLRTTGSYPWRTRTCKFHMTFNMPYIYDSRQGYAGSKQTWYETT